MGFTLAAVALLAAVVSLCAASSLLHRLQAPVSGGTPVTQAGVGQIDQD